MKNTNKPKCYKCNNPAEGMRSFTVYASRKVGEHKEWMSGSTLATVEHREIDSRPMIHHVCEDCIRRERSRRLAKFAASHPATRGACVAVCDAPPTHTHTLSYAAVLTLPRALLRCQVLQASACAHPPQYNPCSFGVKWFDAIIDSARRAKNASR